MDARSRQMEVFELELGSVPDRVALHDYLADLFEFPHPTAGLDAVVDMISDLEWLGNQCGFLFLVRGLKDSSAVGDAFVSMLPNVVDRWRAQAIPFVVAIDGKGNRLLSALLEANRKIEESGKLPWAQPGTGPVSVELHGIEDLGPSG